MNIYDLCVCVIYDPTIVERLSIFLRLQTGAKPFKCEVDGCVSFFSQAPYLLDHRWKHTGSERVQR